LLATNPWNVLNQSTILLKSAFWIRALEVDLNYKATNIARCFDILTSLVSPSVLLWVVLFVHKYQKKVSATILIE